MTAASRDLVAVGASAGGVEALKVLVSGLPADLPATVLVGLHLPAAARSYLAEILARQTRLRVVQAVHGMTLTHGQVVVAQPDAHLLVVDGRVVLGHGATENGVRPSHDTMLRAAALDRRERAVGVVLTGLLDDGAAGLATVARYGGACLVQHPDDADFASMPAAALRAVPSAVAVPLAQLAQEVVRAVTETPPPPPEVGGDEHRVDVDELRSAVGTPAAMDAAGTVGEPSPFGCPDCHGVLNVVPDERVLRFRCRTGHAWNAESLAAKQDSDVEQALWTALRVLEERADISRRLAERAAGEQRAWSQEHFLQRAGEAAGSAELLRSVLSRVSDATSLPTPAREP